jgi:SNF2 family DNA or RNA helicase
VPTKYGGSFTIERLHWDEAALHEVRHRVADRTHSIRKTDPSIRDNFKSMTSMILPVQLSREDARLYDAVLTRADQARNDDEGGLAGFALLLQHVASNPLALLRTDVPFGAELAAKHPRLITSAHCNKLAMFIDQVEAIRDAGDKCVVFTQWVHTSLELISDELRRRDLSHVTHHGQMTRTAAQLAQDQFRGDPSITVFLSSDAGAFGLNLPEAKYVVSYTPSPSWDTAMQRAERINRADSQWDTTAYTMITDDTIEVRIAQVCEERRQLAAATMGTTETLNTTETVPDMRWLIFG